MSIWDTIASWFQTPTTPGYVYTKPKEEIGKGVAGRDVTYGPATTSPVATAPMSTQVAPATPTTTSLAGLGSTWAWNQPTPTGTAMPTSFGYLPEMQGYSATEPLNVTSMGGYDFYYDPLQGWKVLGQTQGQSNYPAGSQIVSKNGWDVLVDNNGNVIDVIGRTGESDISAQQLALQQQQLQLQREQYQAELAAEKEARLAQLSAQPRSWLEYAAYANQAPVIQPWMLPLMPEQYTNLQAGQQIPGWQAQNMQGIPDLINPSAQYLARMGPTALQQYYGYQQANLAQTPEETQWRLWNMAPPSGSNRGLYQGR